jgi:peptide chain release factor 2
LRTIFDPDRLTASVAALEQQMGAPGFWEDQERAAQVAAEHARVSRRLQTYRELERDVDDLGPLAELAEEDAELAGELEEQVGEVERRLAELEEQRLFAGPYDAGDALVTINAGSGGTDAQDWAEMVLRMEMRWAEKRGFQVELLEVSPGEEAGIKSATFLVKGENAYGLYASEKGVHRLVRLSPFDAAHRRHTSFAGVEVSPVVDEIADVEIEEDDLQIDTYRASGAGGQHVNKTDSAVRITHRPTGIVVQCQNERSQSSNKAEAMTMLRSKLLELEERRRREEIAREKGEAQDVNFGSQIRSYVLHPYTMVKDHRTDHEVGDANRVLDGDLDGFVRAYLLKSAGERSEVGGAAASGSARK